MRSPQAVQGSPLWSDLWAKQTQLPHRHPAFSSSASRPHHAGLSCRHGLVCREQRHGQGAHFMAVDARLCGCIYICSRRQVPCRRQDLYSLRQCVAQSHETADPTCKKAGPDACVPPALRAHMNKVIVSLATSTRSSGSLQGQWWNKTRHMKTRMNVHAHAERKRAHAHTHTCTTHARTQTYTQTRACTCTEGD